jgi:ribonuclease Z
MKRKLKLLGTITAVAGLVMMVYLFGLHSGQKGQEFSLTSEAVAAGGKVTDPTGIAPDRYVYYPGTEKLKADEIRIVVCGSGMPAARRGQAATCFLVETGNGDKFLFDVGTGSMANVAALMIPYDYLDKVFLTHLHVDHMGDIDALWAGGWTGGRTKPLRIWGPSGKTPEMGTKYAMENFLKHANWDFQTRAFNLNPKPGLFEITEFDYKGENKVVYQENGVTIRSWPAIHTGDGPVSYSLEYQGLKVVIGGDTFPNRWFLKYAKDADLAIHEGFMGPEGFVKLYNMPPQLAWRACCAFHTSGQAFGKMMSEVKPRHAVVYHFFNEEATRYALLENIRETYDGPISLATDMMMWNITKNSISERMAVSADEAWPVPSGARFPKRDPSYPNPFTKWILDGRVDRMVQPVQKKMLDEFMEKYNLQDQDWRKQMKKKR